MLLTRRLLIGTLAAAPALGAAHAQSGDPRMAERGIGKPDAKTTVLEYFSLTCTHCAAFQKETFPDVKAKLIDTGTIRYVWRDYPLDQVALIAAMVVLGSRASVMGSLVLPRRLRLMGWVTALLMAAATGGMLMLG